MSEIATRKMILKHKEDDRQYRFTITVEKPELDPTERYCCSFRVAGLPCGSYLRKAYGIDSLEALQQAMEIITLIVNCIPAQFDCDQDGLTYNDVGGLGVTYIPSIEQGCKKYKQLRFSEALPLLLPFARQGVAELQLIVGSIYFLGEIGGVPNDAATARHWLLAAANQGNGHEYSMLCDPSLREDGSPDSLYKEYAQKAIEGGFLMSSGQ